MVGMIPQRYVPDSGVPSENQLSQGSKPTRSARLPRAVFLLIAAPAVLAGCAGVTDPSGSSQRPGDPHGVQTTRNQPSSDPAIGAPPIESIAAPGDTQTTAGETQAAQSGNADGQSAGFRQGTPSTTNIWTVFGSELRLPTSTKQPEVQAALRAYARDRDIGRVFNGRGAILLPLVVAEARRSNMPLELAFLPFVESKLNPTASNAGNVGMWQFQAATARLLGLQTGPGVDERKDPVRATRAAFSYLRRLHDIFDDWLLALVAYNIGDGRLKQILAADSTTRDIWKLDLPAHTRVHMAKLCALWQIARNPEAAGIDLPWVADGLDVRRITLDSDDNLRSIAAAHRAPVDTIALLNAHLDAGQLRAGTAVWLTNSPTMARTDLPVSLSIDDGKRLRGDQTSNASQNTEQTYYVRSGDSLYRIARRFGTEVAALKLRNRLSADALHIGQPLVIPKL